MQRWLNGFLVGLIISVSTAFAAVMWDAFPDYSPSGGEITNVGLQSGANVKFPRNTFPVVLTYLGSELVTDGNLATDPSMSGWTLNDAIWTTGQIVATYDGMNNPAFTLPITVENGATYIILFTQSALSGDLTAINFAHAAPRALAGAIGQNAVLFDGAMDGEEDITFTFDQFNIGATHTITSISVRKIADPANPLTTTNFAGTPLFTMGAYDGNVNIALGSGYKTVGGYNNVNIGIFAGYSIDTGYDNVNIGDNAGFSLLSNSNNVNIGAYAGYHSFGDQNLNIGNTSGYALTSGGANVNIGIRAGVHETSSSGTVAIGSNSCSAITTANSTICIGNNVDAFDATTDTQINIGNVFQYNGVDLANVAQKLSIIGATPASASAACATGTVVWDSSFIYVCIATDTWKRVGISTW